MLPIECLEAERVAQCLELLVAGWPARGIVGERVRVDPELVPHESERRPGDQLFRSEQPSRIAQRAELDREAQTIVRTPPAVDDAQVIGAERPMPHQVGLVLGQCEQHSALRLGENGATWH